MNRDFLDMLSALEGAGVEYMIIGAHAVAAHGQPRATGDLDIWVRASQENAQRTFQALKEFGAPLHDLTTDDLTNDDTVFQIGLPPSRIDILTSISGVDFDRAWLNRIRLEFEGTSVYCIGKRELIENKRATGRPRDIADVSALEDIQ
jgi:molybdenum cofactor biosynthesis enzyme MoaA